MMNLSDARYYKRTLIKETIHSHALGEERGIVVYLPPGYQEIVSYPIVYCQDGDEFFNFGRIATQANRLILDEGVEPFLIVGIPMNQPHRFAEYSPVGSRFNDYCCFFAEEMVPYVEQRYPVQSELRILAGDSLGGTVSLHLALDRPALFRNAITLSGAFYESTRERIASEADLSHLRLYMLAGLQETEVQTDHGTYDFLQMNRDTVQLLKHKGADLTYSEADGKHIWGFWQKYIPEALMHFMNE